MEVLPLVDATPTFDLFREFKSYDQEALRSLASRISRPGANFVEVGSGKGGSATVLGGVAREISGHLFAVDPLRGSSGVEHHKDYVPATVGSEFLRNMSAVGVADFVHLVVAPSVVAAAAFKDGFFDLVFIDADHRYSCVTEDLAAWIPKVRKGGILCGHDCDVLYNALSPDARRAMDAYLEQDSTSALLSSTGCGIHCGVVKALGERFPVGLHTSDLPSTVWWVQF